MKKLLLATLFLTSAAFAQPHIPQPQCNEAGRLAYVDFRHMYMDLCINGLKATTPIDCKLKIDQLKMSGKFNDTADNFFLNKEKRICRKK